MSNDLEDEFLGEGMEWDGDMRIQVKHDVL